MSVTVLVCTFGSDEWKERGDIAAASVYGQPYRDEPDELIRIHLLDATLSAVRNAAARSATSDWLCFLDADDELGPGYLAAMRRAIIARQQNEAGDVQTESGPRPVRNANLLPPALLVPAVQYLTENGRPYGLVEIPDWGKPIHETNCAVIGTLVPRQLFLQVGGFPEEPIYEDWACWLACIRAGATLVPVEDAVYRARVRPDSRNAPLVAKLTDVHEVYWRRRREHEQWLEAQP